jgi:hypothetical protein
MQQMRQDSSDDTSSALWHELDVARGDAAAAKGCAAEARANAESAASQLQQLKSLHLGFLQDAQKLLCGAEDSQNGASCHGVLTQLKRVLQHKSTLEQRLADTRQRLVEEQESAVQVPSADCCIHCLHDLALCIGPCRHFVTPYLKGCRCAGSCRIRFPCHVAKKKWTD